MATAQKEEMVVINFYEVLGVGEDASQKQIQQAYRKLAKVKHPDICKEPNATEEFQIIKDAYETLIDPEKKKEWEDFRQQKEAEKDGPGFDDFFRKYHSGLKSAHAPIRGEDIEIAVKFTFKEVKQKAEKVVKFDRFTNCPDCEGFGFVKRNSLICSECNNLGYTLVEHETPFGTAKVEQLCNSCEGKGFSKTEDCEPCKGKGKINQIIELTIRLKENTKDGQRVVLPGRGDHGLNNGAKGNLYLIMAHDPEDEYKMTNDYDLHQVIQVPYLKTLTGGEVSVTAPSGATIKAPIPRGAKQKHQIVIPDEGLLNPDNGYCGTLTLHLEVKMPDSLSDTQTKKMIEILSERSEVDVK